MLNTYARAIEFLILYNIMLVFWSFPHVNILHTNKPSLSELRTDKNY